MARKRGLYGESVARAMEKQRRKKMDNKAIALSLQTIALALRTIADSLVMVANQINARPSTHYADLPEFHELPEAGMLKTDKGWRHP